jgi:hypothetical protein
VPQIRDLRPDAAVIPRPALRALLATALALGPLAASGFA